VFGGRSDREALSQTSKASRTEELSDQNSSKNRVRQQSAASASHRDSQERFQRPAHPSNSLVAQLNDAWRVVDDPLQWKLQRKKGNPRSKNAGWRDRSFCTTREGLLRCVREYCGTVEPSALAMLTNVPEQHGMQNLDVRRTDEARADDHSQPLSSKGLDECTAGYQPSRSRQRALT
jgi:hypothetical protein